MTERKKLPIPLTCRPQIEEGKCVHGLDNGACELPDQFMKKVRIVGECWIWIGARSPKGSKWEYGDYQHEKAHRVAWSRSRKQEIPVGKQILHTCDHTLCVRPSHLFLGTQKDNMQDCLAKGRLVSPPNFGVGKTHWMNDLKKKKAWEKKRWTTQRRAEAAERMRIQWTPAQRRRWVQKREAARAAAKGSRSR
jgi:hypothetical protein